jgi:O-antigen ligase
LTQYRQAHAAALEAFLTHPLAGVGPGSYASFSRDHFAHTLGAGSSHGHYYAWPHSSYLGAAAMMGLPGLAAVLWLVLAVWRERPPPASDERALWLALCALLMIGVNQDVLYERALWLLLGSVSGRAAQRRLADQPPSPPTPTLHSGGEGRRVPPLFAQRTSYS